MVENSGEQSDLPAARGKLIVFEGPDRSGKTTQTHLLVQLLRERGYKVAAGCPLRFPDRTTQVGKLIDSYLRESVHDLDDRVLHLLFSSNRWEKADSILASLRAGDCVIIDRYAYSGVAYSSAKGLDMAWCKSADAGLPKPDLVIYLDIPIEVAMKRGDFGSERFEKVAFQRAVSKQFERLMADNTHADEKWARINADVSKEVLFESISKQVLNLLEGGGTNVEYEKKEIGQLWK